MIIGIIGIIYLIKKKKREEEAISYIIDVFEWNSTPEGSEFWGNLDIEFNQLYENSNLNKPIEIHNESIIEFVKLKN